MPGPVTSGSYPSDAMIILPCAAGVLGRIAHGQAESLIERAADRQFLGLPGTDRYQWDGSDTAARREHTQAR